jgi:hypothetical protein
MGHHIHTTSENKDGITVVDFVSGACTRCSCGHFQHPYDRKKIDEQLQ